MTWDGALARAGLARVLQTAFAGTNITVLSTPPATFNAPALVVQYPQTVTKYVASFGVDLASWTVLGAVGLDQPDTLDGILNDAAAAVFLDPTLSGAVQTTKVVELRNWRIVATGGAELLAAEVALESRM